jgi:pimeloyl-ACP methyl ester carboxylesterase
MELEVPGARLRYDVAGHGPLLLLIPGGPADAAVFAGLVPLLTADYSVATYDPRGLSRSTVADPEADIAVATQAGDARAILDAVSGAPAFVFGNSGGAITGLELAARHPGRVRMLVAHEPPLIELLPDRAAQRAAFDDVADTYRRHGAAAAMGKFMVLAGMVAGAAPLQLPPGMLPAVEFFFARMLRAIVAYQPDFAALRGAPVAVGAGAASAGQVANRGALALAGRLGVAPTEFPGGHGGFITDPEAFAAKLLGVLATA